MACNEIILSPQHKEITMLKYKKTIIVLLALIGAGFVSKLIASRVLSEA